ncbi:MAG: NACHT domain-containing protein, partial [Anaerolineae bacterium]|nr:NACHT domain-containing protein [Anaerolineae bacterium]
MTITTDILTNLAANLAAELIVRTADRLRNLAFGDSEMRALTRAWERAFQTMLEAVAADLNPSHAHLLDDVLRQFIAAEGVGDALLDLALEGREPPLGSLRARFEALEFDQATLPVDFNTALTSLTRGLTDALLDKAGEPGSPLYNRVSVVRIAAIHALLREQRETLATIAAAVSSLEAQLGAAKYNLVFLGPVSGMAIGDQATVRLLPGQRGLLEDIRRLLTEMTAQRRPPPYTDADRLAYLEAVVKECKDIRLPYAQAGRATLPLERVYVALKADRSAPAERRASYVLFRQLVEEERQTGLADDLSLIYQVARLNPYAGRYLLCDPRLRKQLLEVQREAQERTYHLAEIVRRHRWIVLLGDPGSGKTTLARWLALQLGRALQEDRDRVQVPADHVRPDADPAAQEPLGPARLPILVRIADYAAARWPKPGEDTHLPLLNYLGRHVESLLQPGRRPEALHALIRDYLAAGRVTFILDGLDEVTDIHQRQDIAAEIETLIGDWVRDARGRSPLDSNYHPVLNMADDLAQTGGNQLIVTSRIVGYHLRPLHENLPHFVIQPMDDTAVRRFCHNWAEATGIPDRADALAQAVLEHPNPHVRDEMARNPLLLTILAQVFWASPQEGLPARRVELYRRAAEAVFRQRQEQWGRLSQEVGGRDLADALERITAHLAFRLHADPACPAGLADEDRIRCWLLEALADEPALTRDRRPDDVADDLLAAAANLSGFFVARGEGVYGFLHRQFQEYFAARALVARPDAKDLFLSRLGDPAWREVLLLAVGLAGRRVSESLLQAALDAPDPTGGLLPHNLLFVAAALRELDRPPADLVRRVAEGLIRAYRRDDENRFVVLHERIERAFAALPRAVGPRDPVGEALCAALSPSPPTGLPPRCAGGT